MKKQQYKSRYKWKKYKILSEHERFRGILPETRLMAINSFWSMMQKYGTVVLKPDNGQKGKGIYMVFASDQNSYKVRYKDDVLKFTEKERLNKYLAKVTSHTQYLLQQWVELARINDRPFDLRLTVQQNSKRKWIVTGCIGKVAAEDNFVTNVSSGGEMLTLEKALQLADYPGKNTDDMLQRLRDKAIDIAQTVGPHYSRFKAAGIDFGIDKDGHLWFFEINYKPAFYVWEELDPQMYKKMMKLKKYWEKQATKNKQVTKSTLARKQKTRLSSKI